MAVRNVLNNKNIFQKTGIGILLLSAVLFIIFILTSIILLIIGWNKIRKKMGNSLLIFCAVIFLILTLINICSATGLEPPLKVAWRSSIGTWFMEPYPISIDLVESDVVYVNYQNLQAINANDGKLLWRKDWSAGIAYKDGILYAIRDFLPSLYALDAMTGEEIWKKDFPELKRGIADRYNLAILDDTLYITTADGNTNIMAVDTNGIPVDIEFEKFPAMSSKRFMLSTEATYKDRLYLIRNGKLYSYEHGYEVSKYIYFAIFCIILIIAYPALKTGKYSERFQRSFAFSALLSIVVYSLVLTVGIMEYYFIEISDLFAISLTLEDWVLYLFFPAASVIAGTFASIRIENKFFIGVIAGVLPFSIIFAVSFLILPDSYYFILTIVPFISSIYYIFLISLIFGTIGTIIGFTITQIKNRD